MPLTLSRAPFLYKNRRGLGGYWNKIEDQREGGNSPSPVYLDVIYSPTLVSHLECTHTECKTAAWHVNEWEFKPSFRFHSSELVGLQPDTEAD